MSLVRSTEQYSVEELRLRAKHLAKSYRARVWASQAVERFFGSLKSECLDKMIFFGQRSLQNAVRQFLLIIMAREIIKG